MTSLLAMACLQAALCVVVWRALKAQGRVNEAQRRINLATQTLLFRFSDDGVPDDLPGAQQPSVR